MVLYMGTLGPKGLIDGSGDDCSRPVGSYHVPFVRVPKLMVVDS